MTQAANLANFANNLDSSGGLNPSALNAPVPYSKGGTNASTQALAQSNMGVMTGEIKMWALGTAPSGYLLCDGSAVSRSTYSSLFAIYGTTFGSGDGSTTFNLPNFKDRMPIGAGNLYSVNQIGGSADAIVVSHTHSATSVVTDPGHQHSIGYSQGILAAGGNATQFVVANNNSNKTQTAVTGISVATTNANAGVSGTNANLPPYLGIYFIVKT